MKSIGYHKAKACILFKLRNKEGKRDKDIDVEKQIKLSQNILHFIGYRVDIHYFKMTYLIIFKIQLIVHLTIIIFENANGRNLPFIFPKLMSRLRQSWNCVRMTLSCSAYASVTFRPFGNWDEVPSPWSINPVGEAAAVKIVSRSSHINARVLGDIGLLFDTSAPSKLDSSQLFLSSRVPHNEQSLATTFSTWGCNRFWVDKAREHSLTSFVVVSVAFFSSANNIRKQNQYKVHSVHSEFLFILKNHWVCLGTWNWNSIRVAVL